MHTNAPHTIGCRSLNQSDEVVDMAVNVPIRHKTQQVKGVGADEFCPHLTFKTTTGLDGLLHEFCTLIKDAPRAHGVARP